MSPLLPSECPNCGRLHSGRDFNAEPGPVQAERNTALHALRDAHKLAGYIIEHEGHDDVTVCLEEVIATARSIQTVAALGGAGVATGDTQE